MDLEEIKVYRMTHIDNMPHILQFGITHRNSPNHNPNFTAIGDFSLINVRDNKQVTVDNGNFLDFEAPTITLGHFIPFYFGIKMPMLYVIQNGGNFVIDATPPRKIVYLACSVRQIITKQKSYYFSDGHATDNLTTFYDETRINALSKIVDWNAIRASYWGGQENLNLKRKKQAEFLVSEDIPPNLIIGFGCYNNTAKDKLIDLGINEDKIKIIPNAYY